MKSWQSARSGSCPKHSRFAPAAIPTASRQAAPAQRYGVARVSLCHFLDATLKGRYKVRILTCTAFRKSPAPTPAEDEKTLDARLDATIAGITISNVPNHRSRKIVDRGGPSYSARVWRATPALTNGQPMCKRGHSHFALTELTRWQQLGYLTSTLPDGAAYRPSYR
jgi:hypothetical protein